MWIVIPSACAAAAAVRFEATAFIAHLVDHIPDKGQVLQRYYGYYANRTRGVRRKAQAAEDAMRVADVADVMRTDAELPPGGVTSESKGVSLADAQRRWADLLRRIYEVDPLLCPKCGGPMRVIAVIRDPKVVDKILRHLRAQGRDARAGPWATGPPAGGAATDAA